jgi:hypothetical protein
MAARKDLERTRGLPSLQASREQRRRALVFGKVRFREAAPQFWLWSAVGILAFTVVYWHFSERELARQKSAVMAKQRAIAKGLEPELLPLREKLESWVLALAGDWSEGHIDPALSLDDLRTSKGIYLRMLADNATSGEAIKKAAETSLHDGFTSCMFERQERMYADQGEKCFSTSQCPDGEFCNEYGVCAPPSQPFNLRIMYRVFRILGSDWTDELHAAGSDYEVRLFERDLEKVVRTDVKVTTELIGRARYFTALLDELPRDGLPEHPEGADAGALGREELRVQGYDHKARLGIWDLRSGELVFRGKFKVGADFIPMGRMKSAPQKVLDAQQRQVNNCGIASDFRARVKAAHATQEVAGSASEANPSGEQAPENDEPASGDPTPATPGASGAPQPSEPGSADATSQQ